MYKSKLQELCQRRGWDLPLYSTNMVGQGHNPRFTASVTVKGDMFSTPIECKSSKEAQNAAAQIAFEHFLVLPPPPQQQLHAPVYSSGPQAVISHTAIEFTPAKRIASDDYPVSLISSSLPVPSTENLHIYKNQLQHYAQTHNLGFPVYTWEAEGPPHCRRFKSIVSVGGKSYVSPEYSTTLREAEQASARIACQKLSVDVTPEDGGRFKNLLQELCQKQGLQIPSYDTVCSGMSHMPVFLSTVVAGSGSFRGAGAKTKKQAEMNAAKVAYNALIEGSLKENSQVSVTNGLAIGDNRMSHIQPLAMANQHRNSIRVEEAQIVETKTSPGKMTVNTHHHPSEGPSQGHFSYGNPSKKSKVVVFPRKLNFPVPESAHVLPHSDERWVAYRTST